MAITNMKAVVKWTKEGVYCEGESRGFKVALDEPKELGGTDKAMNPVELLLNSLGGCMAICAAAFAKKCKVNLQDCSVEIVGDIDLDGFMGLNPNVRNGYSEIRYKLNIVSDSPQENIEKLIQVIEEKCPVSDTLKGVKVVRVTD